MQTIRDLHFIVATSALATVNRFSDSDKSLWSWIQSCAYNSSKSSVAVINWLSQLLFSLKPCCALQRILAWDRCEQLNVRWNIIFKGLTTQTCQWYCLQSYDLLPFCGQERCEQFSSQGSSFLKVVEKT